jgi:hypothetical protein
VRYNLQFKSYVYFICEPGTVTFIFSTSMHQVLNSSDYIKLNALMTMVPDLQV